jgi:hypothetical protein
MGEIDSQVVNKAIRKFVWSKLKIMGFRKFTSRNACRFGSAMHVVNFQSFNSYNAAVLGCTTFSFAVNLGLHFDFMPSSGGTKYLGPDNPPKEYECIFRKPLRRSLSQPKNPDPRIWFVDPDGQNVESCVVDALELIEREALPWFDEFSDPIAALRIVDSEQEQFDKFGPNGTWGFGRPGSPVRERTIDYLKAAILELQKPN